MSEKPRGQSFSASPQPSDAITLTGLRAWGRHGVLAHEREAGQEFSADLRLEVDLRAAARGDALGRTVNYAEVTASAVEEIEGEPHQLIETLAERIAQRVLAEHVLIRRIAITIHKPSAPIPHPFADVTVQITRDAAPVDAVLALGTNLGDRAAHLRGALESLRGADGVEIAWTAPVIETDPVGGVEQAAFLNTAIGIRTVLGPWTLLDLAQRLEQDAQRVREVRWGPRTLDVDLISYGDLIQDDPELTLPHPRAHERAFVLAPWLQAQADAELPGRGRVAALLEHAPDRHGIRPGPRIPGFGAVPERS